MKRKILLLGLLVLLLSTACIAPVSAHRAFAGAFMTGDVEDEVMIRAWYEGGAPMADADITIYAVRDGEEEVYIEDVTDELGFYSFEPEWRVTEYRILVEQTGHRAEIDLDLESGTSTGSESAELPLVARVVAGFGYLLGLAGIAMIYSAKMQNRGPE